MRVDNRIRYGYTSGHQRRGAPMPRPADVHAELIPGLVAVGCQVLLPGSHHPGDEEEYGLVTAVHSNMALVRERSGTEVHYLRDELRFPLDSKINRDHAIRVASERLAFHWERFVGKTPRGVSRVFNTLMQPAIREAFADLRDDGARLGCALWDLAQAEAEDAMQEDDLP